MQIGKRKFDVKNRTYVMGILNLTPDSFSDGGSFNQMDKALFHTEEMIRDGADIIDVGGESTRPGYTVITAEEEIERVAPAIDKIRGRFDIPISIDTYKARVAEAAIEAGADLVNDIWGLKADTAMASLIAKTGTACCLMHNRQSADYADFLDELTGDMKESVRLARQAGIPDDKLMLDPGVGFGKTYEMNLTAIRHTECLQKLGYPVLLGVSRKSVIGTALDLPVGERLEGTLAITAMAVMKGCSFVRVHDVKENKRVIAMIEAILGK